MPIHEPGLPELIERNRERLTFTTEMAELLDGPRLLFVCVQTPPTYSGDADLSAVQRAVEEIGEPDGKALVMKSTVRSGPGRTIHRDAPDLAYVSCPEFLKEGTAVKDFLEPDRVVVGADAGRRVGRRRGRGGLRAAWGADRPHRPLERRDDQARLERLPGDQDQLHQRDRERLRRGRRGRHRGRAGNGAGPADRRSRFLNAGLGFGGSCFPKDTQALKILAGNSGYHFQLLNSVIEVNELQKRRVMAKLSKHLDSLVGKRVALLGLAFKPDTDDMREASSLVLAAASRGGGRDGGRLRSGRRRSGPRELLPER